MSSRTTQPSDLCWTIKHVTKVYAHLSPRVGANAMRSSGSPLHRANPAQFLFRARLQISSRGPSSKLEVQPKNSSLHVQWLDIFGYFNLSFVASCIKNVVKYILDCPRQLFWARLHCRYNKNHDKLGGGGERPCPYRLRSIPIHEGYQSQSSELLTDDEGSCRRLLEKNHKYTVTACTRCTRCPSQTSMKSLTESSIAVQMAQNLVICSW